ncbi:sperm-associated microtubule inner protein 10-like [Saccoglossus kowalevskii]|uniref:Uncharacterized protein C5orf48-like n=1 Tax=Saccoglossus kowalevskii TaxID=10224 RepID=A0ABM0GTH7_SACKO|nr:PREDICTED: uncharacterized protein C5orf48-like [Saccoglossus kowalevskii]
MADRLATGGSYISVPRFSKYHPVIPIRYVPEWKNDMRNRNLIIKNCEMSGIIPTGPHDESLFLEKRERMNEVEPRARVDAKRPYCNRYEQLRPQFHTPQSKYHSALMFRKDDMLESKK